jgi:CheY-like chemotaxis protein
MNGREDVDVLVVEDNPADLELMLIAFRKHGYSYKVAVAKDGAEAIDFVYGTGPYANRDPASNPKLILLDLKLPRVGGLEVLYRIKSDPEKKLIPVVVFTSSALDQDIEECYRAGANSYIQKPINFERFQTTVTAIAAFWMQLNLSPFSVASLDHQE